MYLANVALALARLPLADFLEADHPLCHGPPHLLPGTKAGYGYSVAPYGIAYRSALGTSWIRRTTRTRAHSPKALRDTLPPPPSAVERLSHRVSSESTERLVHHAEGDISSTEIGSLDLISRR